MVRLDYASSSQDLAGVENLARGPIAGISSRVDPRRRAARQADVPLGKMAHGNAGPDGTVPSPSAMRNDATQRSLASMLTPNTYLPGSTGVAESLPLHGTCAVRPSARTVPSRPGKLFPMLRKRWTARAALSTYNYLAPAANMAAAARGAHLRPRRGATRLTKLMRHPPPHANLRQASFSAQSGRQRRCTARSVDRGGRMNREQSKCGSHGSPPSPR